MKLRLFLIVLICSLAMTIYAQDDDPQTGWEIEERCIDNPTYPPDDWTYDGTLLMSGYAGIHAMQADWETPRIEAFFSSDEFGEPLIGGQLSPDGNWYAMPIGTHRTARSYNQYWRTYAIRVFSLVDDTVLTFPIDDYAEEIGWEYLAWCTSCLSWIHDTVQWLDDETLVSAGLRIQPFDDIVELATFGTARYYYPPYASSPDRQYIVNQEYVYELENWDEIITSVDSVNGASWKRDSSGFIVSQYGGNSAWAVDYVSLYNRDGEFTETIMYPETYRSYLSLARPVSGRSELAWAFDDTYFAFNLENRLMILDMQTQIIIDTCLEILEQPTWSSDTLQLGVLTRASQNLDVVIVDIENWRAYIVARHINQRGMFPPGIIGWRSNN